MPLHRISICLLHPSKYLVSNHDGVYKIATLMNVAGYMRPRRVRHVRKKRVETDRRRRCSYRRGIFDQAQTPSRRREIVWALAKQTGKFDDILRYPGEDSAYEKPKMDKLGL